MPMGHQSRRRNSPIGVPRPIRVRISFSSLLVRYIDLPPNLFLTAKNAKATKKKTLRSLRSLRLNSTWGLRCQIHLGVPGTKHAQFVQRFLEILEIVVIADR